MEEVFYKDDDILRLITCEKIIVRKPTAPKKSNRDMKTTLTLESVVDNLEFFVFFSQNIRISNDFSLGLMYSKFNLFRVNGFHGTTKDGIHKYEHHQYPHSHTLTIDDIDHGRLTFPTKIADMTGNYYDFESAQLFFLKKCGIINYESYFSFSNAEQMNVFDL